MNGWGGLVGISIAGAVALSAGLVVAICQAAKRGDEPSDWDRWEREHQDGAEVEW